MTKVSSVRKINSLEIKKTGLGIEFLLLFIVLFAYHFFYLFDYDFGFISFILKFGEQFIIGALCCLTAVCVYLFYRNVMRPYGRYIPRYCIVVFGIFLLVALYTIIIYPNQKIQDTFRIGGRFLHPILAVGFIYIFERDKGPDRWISILNKLSFLWYVYLILQSVWYAINGSLLFDFASYFTGDTVNVRNDALRVGLGSFGNIILIYNFVQVLCYRRRSLFILVQVVLGLFCLIAIQQTRMYILITFVCIAVMFFLKGKSKWQIIFAPLIILALGIFLAFSNIVSDFFASFSITGELAGSTIARLDAIEYYWNVFIDNPLLGFGWPGDESYFSIAHGPLGTAYLSDIGFLGLLAGLGFFAIPFYLVPLIRVGYILHKIGWKRVCQENMFLIVLFVYLIATSITLLITDSGRSIAFPFMIALFEYYNGKRLQKYTRSKNEYHNTSCTLV